jgi:hypothetical protein
MDHRVGEPGVTQTPLAPAQRRRATTEHPMLALQRAVGNRAMAQLAQRAPSGTAAPPAAHAPGAEYLVVVSGEPVLVRSDADEQRAKSIIDTVSATYRISVDSLKGVKATKDHYANAPQAERDKIAAIPWHIRELVAVKKALDHFAPILGQARSYSTRGAAAQEISTLGKVNTSITKNTAAGVADPDTLGEFYGSSSTFAIYQSSETSTEDFPGDVDKQIEATTTHEIAHGLMHYMIDSFIAATGFWLDEDTKSGTSDAEHPPTDYGNKNAREDLSESVMLYFVDEARLKSSCPKRHAAIREAVTLWAAPVGDFPTPDPNATTAMA